MALEPNDLWLFARVVDEGSFSRAAERTGLPKSTISRRVAALEGQLGERLLLRTTRKLTVTDFGHGVLEHARQLVAEVEAAQSLAHHRQARPSGRLRVSMPGDFANIGVTPMLGSFIAAYPDISLEIDLSARRVDLIGENFDVAIRMGKLADDASLAARQLAEFSTGLYASPAYLEHHGTPAHPDDLASHHTLRLLPRAGEPAPWVLTKDGERWEGAPPGRVLANSPDMLIRLASDGVGITSVGDMFAEPYVLSGQLVPVLPEWDLPPHSAWAVFPGRRLMPARTRVFLDALAAHFSPEKCEAHRKARRRA
jgi:DNA-binding transcriptional LysR family regulator